MPALEPRRPSTGRPQKHGLRAHSRTSSATKIHTMGGLTAGTREASKEKEARGDPTRDTRRRVAENVKTPNSDSGQPRSPSRETVSTARKGSGLGPSRQAKFAPPVAADNDEDDDDAWISSESGAATPNRTPDVPSPVVYKGKEKELDLPAESCTPPAIRQPLPPAEPFIRTPSPTDTARMHGKPPTRLQSSTQSPHPDILPHPQQNHPHHHHLHALPLHLHKPHPLIRTTSYTTPVASPSFLTATQSTPLSESPPSASPGSSIGGGRKPSFSSTRSAATLPVPFTDNAVVPRERTLSSMSASSAALALAAIPRFTSSNTTNLGSSSNVRQQPANHLPPVSKFYNPEAEEEDSHPLLRQPYLCDHLSILRYHDPLRDSARRVDRAKAQS